MPLLFTIHPKPAKTWMDAPKITCDSRERKWFVFNMTDVMLETQLRDHYEREGMYMLLRYSETTHKFIIDPLLFFDDWRGDACICCAICLQWHSGFVNAVIHLHTNTPEASMNQSALGICFLFINTSASVTVCGRWQGLQPVAPSELLSQLKTSLYL